MTAEQSIPVEETLESGTVVVGLDRSRGAKAAVDFALCDPARHGVQVEAVTAHEPADTGFGPTSTSPTPVTPQPTTAPPSKAPET